MGIDNIRKRIKRILALVLAFAMLISNFSDFRLVVKADATLTQNSDGGEEPGEENGNGGQTQTTLMVRFDGDVAETEEYTGEAINLPGLVVTDGTEQLESTAYTVAWTNEKGELVSESVTNAGTYTCTVTVNEDPSKVGEITFKVTPKSIQDATVSGIGNVSFDGNNVSGLDGLTVKLNGAPLVENRDYTVTYVNSAGDEKDSISKEGIYTLQIIGKGNYTGTLEQELKVTRNINTMDLSIEPVTYNGQAVAISNLKVNGLNCDYSVTSVEDAINAGVYLLIVTANDENGIYTGSKTVTFTINKLDLALCTVNVEPSAIPYTGDKVDEPSVKVIYDGNVIPDENYNVAYSPDTLQEKGDYSVNVTAMDNGNLTGSTTADFCIVYSGLFEAKDAVSGTIEQADMSGLSMVYNSTENKYFYKLDNDADEKKVTIKPQENYEFVKILSPTSDKIEAVIDRDKNLVITFLSQDTAVIAEENISITLLVKNNQDEFKEISITLAEASAIAFEEDSEVNITYGKEYSVTENENTIYWANKITKIDFPEVSESGAGDIIYYYSTNNSGDDKKDFNPNTISDYSIFDSETTYCYWAEDALGNQTEPIEFTICKLDPNAPTITVKKKANHIADIANESIVYWNAGEAVNDGNGGKLINIFVEPSDSESGLTENYSDGIQSSFSVIEGIVSSTEIFQSISDKVGNSAEHTFTAVYDPIAPTVDVELTTYGIITADSTDTKILSSDDVTITFKITGEAKYNDIVLLDRVDITDDKDNVIKTFGLNELTYKVDGTEPYYEGTYTVTTEDWLKKTFIITAFDNAGNEGENSSVTITIEIDKIAPEITDDSISIKPEVTGKDNWTKENTVFVVTVPNNAADKDSSAKVYLEYKKEDDPIWSKVSDYVSDENGNLIFETLAETDDFYKGNYLFRVSDELENKVDHDNNGEADAVRYWLKKDKVAPESTAYIQFISDIKGANENTWVQEDDSWYSQISEMVSSLWNKIWGRTTLSFEVYVRDEYSEVDVVKVSYGGTSSILEKPVDGIEVVALEGNTDGGYQKKTPVEDGDNSYTVYTGRITIPNSDIEYISYKDFAISEIKDNAGNTTTDISLKNADDNTVIYLDSVKPKLTGVEIASDKLVRETYYYNKEVSVALTIEERFLKDAEAPKVEIYKKTSKDTQFTTSSIVENLEWNLVEGTTQYTTNIPLECVSEEEIEYQIRVTYKDGSDNELVSEDYRVIDGVYTSPTIVLDGKAPELTNYAITENPSGEVNGISVYKNNVESDVTVTFTLDDNAEYWNGYQNQLLITVKDSISGVELVRMDGTNSEIEWSHNDRAHTGTFTFDGEREAASNYQVTISYTDRAGNAMVIDNAAITEGNHEGNTYTGKEFILDHVAPVFNISYNTPYLFRTAGDTALSSDDKSGTEIDMKNVSGYTAHYKEDIEVSFTIDEQYAVPMMENTAMTGLNDCIVTVIKDGVEIETLPEITWTKANIESDYEGKFTLTEDGTYEIIVNYQDTAANAMVAGDAVNGVASMADGSYQSIKLVLDKTVPVVSVAYVDQTTQTEAVPTEADGRIYFTNPVNMRITVTDSYIRTEELRKVILDALVVKDADGKDITENTVNTWLNELVSNDAEVKANEVVWDIPLTTEANYTFDFVYTDLVGLSGNKVLEKVTVDKTTPEADDAWIAFSSDVEGANEQSILDKLHQFWNKIWGRTEIGFIVYVRDEIADIASMEVSYVVDDTEDNVIEYSTIDANRKPLTIQNDKYQVKNEAENVTVEYVMITGTLTLSDITDASDLLLNQFTITSLKDKAGNDACEENVITFSKDGYSGNIYLDNQNPKLVNVYVDETFIKEAELPYHYNKEVEVVLEVDERFLHDAVKLPEVTLLCKKTSALAAGEVKTWEEVVENLNWDNKVSNTVSTYYTTVTLPVAENAEMEYQIQMSYQDGAENLLISSDSSAYSVENGIYTSEIIVVDDVAPELTAYEISGNSDREVNGISVYKNVEDDDVTVTVTLDDNAEYWNGYQNQLLIKVKDSISGVELVRMDGTDSDITWSDNDRAHTGTFTFDGESEAASNYLVTISYTDRAGNAMVIDNAAITEGSYAGNTYTSKEFILDHVAPVFNISYNTPYRNVKEGNAVANDVLGAEDENLQPQTGYTSYYQDEIVATFTIDEQYANFANELVDSTITLYKDGEEISLENNLTVNLTWEAQETTYKGTLTIKADEENNVSADGNYQIQINYLDTAKNNMTAGEKVYGSESATPVTNGTYKSTTLVLDTTSPEIMVAYVDETTKEEVTPVEQRGERIYFAKPVNMRITVEDVNLRDHELKKYLSENFKVTDINGKSILSSAAENEINTPKYLSISEDGTTITWNIPLSTDANYEFPISYEDLAGNITTYTTQKVTKDQSPPHLKLEYSFANSGFWDAINYKDLGFLFADHKLTIQANASDEITGVHIIKFTILDEHGNKTEKLSTIEEPTYTSSFEVAIPWETNDFNGVVKVEVLDLLENTREESHGYIVESTEKHSTTGSAKITTKTAPSRIVEGVKYYNTSVDLNITLEDNYSGLRSYEYKAGKDKEMEGSYSYAEKAGDDLSAEKEHSITKLYSKDLTLDGKVNNENDVLVTAKLVDNAGHVTSVEQKYNIDTTVPEITVEYDLNEPSFEKFYHQTRTATVKIKERNFSEKDVDFTITNTDGEIPSIGNWSKSGSGDDTVHTCQIVFSADGDYTFTLAFQDLAGNKAKYDRTDEFTIDQTKPVYTVSYDNNNSLNDYYYAQTRTATIDILEHNFDASLINVVMTANAGGVVPSVSSWSRDGDHNIATVTFSTDGDYTFTISGKDQAENEMDAYAQERFIIDLTAPEVEIFDIEPNSANNGIVMPGIRYSDTNYDINGSSVHMVGYHNGEVEMKGTTSRTDTGVEVKLNDFEHVQAMDDLYTMNAVVSDLAGNITEASVTFSVNRYGSVYTFDEITDKLVGDEGNFYTNEEQDIVVIETNVDTLEFKEITCNLNGTLTTLVEGEDYTVSESGTDASWKQYTYTIAKENFVEEGNYLLTIYSEDRALNTSDSNTKNKRIEFVVDKTMPSVLISGVENDGQYRENSRPVTLDIEDNVMLSEVKVILNGEEIVYPASEISATDGRLEFVIDSYNDWQTLQVIAIDKAGNENASEEMRFLVTANVFVQFFRNKTLVWGTAGGMTVAAGGIYWLLLARRKRKVTFKK